jgi:hypothetical protein
LEIFGKTIKENSNTFSMAFGGATAGAKQFAEISGKVMDKQGQSLAKLGFSIDEISEYSASYIEQMTRSGRAQNMLTTELAAGAEKYNLELDRLSKATGISRQQLDEANKAAQRDTRMRLALSNLGETERNAITAKIEELKKIDPTGKLAAGFSDLIAGGGVALTKEARMFTLAMSQAGVDAGKMTRDIANGQAGAVEQVNAGFKQVAVSARNMSDAEKKTTTAMATLGQDTPMYVRASFAALGDGNAAMAAATKEQADKLKSEDLTRGAAGLDQTLTNVQNSLKKTFIESGVLDDTAKAMGGAVTATESFVKSMQGMNMPALMTTMFGAAFAKEIIASLSTIAIGVASGYAGNKLAGVKKEPAVDTDSKKTKTPDGPDGKKVPNAGKVAEEALEDVDNKGSWWKRAIEALKRNKKIIVGTTVGGAVLLFSEEAKDLAIAGFDKLTGANFGGRETKSTTEYLDGNKPTVAGAEVSKATEAAKNIVPEGTQASMDKSGETVKLMNNNVRELNESLKTINWNLVNLTIVYDGDPANTLTEVLQDDYPYKVKCIDTKSYKGYSYEPNCMSSKSLCLVSEIIKNDNLPEDELIYILENDYLHLPGWCEEVLDLYNNLDKYAFRDPKLHFANLYHHPDKMIFTNPNATNEFGMYKDLESKIIATKYRYWRYVPSLCSSWLMSKYLFDNNYDLFNHGFSDNTASNEFIKRGYYQISPIETLSTHCQLPWLSFYIDWEKVSNN